MKPYNERSQVLSSAEAKRLFPRLDEDAWARLAGVFPVRVTRSWAERIRDVTGPLGLQAFPAATELDDDPGDVPDPVGEEGKMPVPWVVRKHEDRALLLVTRRCHLHCRYCFRRDLDGDSAPTPEALDTAIAYLKQSTVREVILSGGDPLTLRTERLAYILDELRPSIPLVRLHTRAPVTFPARIDPALVDMLRSRGPVWLVIHCNHPDELSEPVRAGISMLVDAGIPVLNQSVLLRGVNDDVDVLASLTDALLQLRVKPYYLHHPDAVPGGASFRVSIEEGLALHDALRQRVSGIGLPAYVIDPPDGTGKVSVAEWVANSVPSVQ